MKVIATFLLVGLSPVVTGSAQEKECTREEALTAEATAAGLRSWPEIVDSFRKFGHCDDGAIAEGYQVAIVGMLADRWVQVDALPKLFAAEPPFRPFVFRHLNDAVPKADFDRLVANAAVRCPPSAASVCSAILEHARELERRLEQHRKGRGAPHNKRMQLTKLRAAPVLQAEVPPCAPAGESDGGTASQLIRGVGRTRSARKERTGGSS